MLSPAQRHVQKTMAAINASQSDVGKPTTGDAYEITFAALIEDRRRLKTIQSVQAKIEAKKKMLPQYQPYIDGVLLEGKGSTDEIMSYMMLWHIDVGELHRAAEIGAYLIRYKQETPDQWQRSVPAILAEEGADLILKDEQYKLIWHKGELNKPKQSYIDTLVLLQSIATLVENEDMHDQIRAKLFKAIATLQSLRGEYDAAHQSFNRALKYDANCRVKKHVERLDTLIRRESTTNSES